MTHIVVWNPHSQPAQQVIELTLDLPAGQYPAQVVGPDGEVCAFGWTESGVFSLLPEVPPVGYATYTLDLSDQPPTGDSLARTTPGDLIRSMTGDTLMIENGQIIWNHQGIAIPDVLRFFDSGDAGDTYNYSPPDPDIMVQAQLTGTISVEHAPLYERLTFRHRMRIAPELDANRGRDRGVRLMELSTTATFYDHMPGLYFRTTFENAAGDHRLRAHLRTGIASETVLADAAFALVERPVVVPGPEIPPEGQANIEGVMSTHPMQNLCAVLEGENTVALMARGLPEFQAIPEDDQTTLALTLLRAVGWLSRDDLRTRTGSVGPMLAVPGAQCLRPMATEYALVSLEDGNPADLLRLGQAYRAPLPAYQYDHPPEQRSYSYLSVEGDRVVMTALKPPQEGEGWLVRLLNPTDEPAEAMLIAHARLSGAELVTLAEEAQAEFELENPEQVHLTLEPHKITTLRLRFQ